MATFRARQAGEEMGAYLKAKQAYETQSTGKSGVDFGTPATTPTPPSITPANQPSAQTYTVKSGDTLFEIAQRYGVNVSDITGYRSGNPNLIYPGEVLNIGGAGGIAPTTPTVPTTPTIPTVPTVPTVPIPPTAPPATTGAGTAGTDWNSILTSLGGGTANTYRQQMVDLLTKLGQQQTAYTTALENLPTPEATYDVYREKLGLPGAEAGLTATNVQIEKTQNLLDELENNINARISGKMITEPIRQRQLAVEQRPLQEQLAALGRTAGVQQAGVSSARDQLSQMLQLAGQGQAQQLAAAKAPMEMTQGLLPTLTSLAQYQSPQEQLAQQIAQQQALKEAGLGQYYQEPTTPATTSDIKEYEYAKSQGYTGTFEEWKTGGGTPTGMTYDEITAALYAVGLPSSTSTTKGEMTKGNQDKLVAAGIPLATALGIWNAILSGSTLEDIRQYFRANGVDPKILDTFMQTLQGVGGKAGGLDFENY